MNIQYCILIDEALVNVVGGARVAEKSLGRPLPSQPYPPHRMCHKDMLVNC